MFLKFKKKKSFVEVALGFFYLVSHLAKFRPKKIHWSELSSYILYIKVTLVSVYLCEQKLSSAWRILPVSHCPFLVECFRGWGKGKPGETRGKGGQHGRGRIDGCIMHWIHTSGGVAGMT
jgi:hypothetical protein